jgi:hypothetical protein
MEHLVRREVPPQFENAPSIPLLSASKVAGGCTCELRRTGSGGLVAVLATGAELPVARSRQARIRHLR